MMQNSDTLNATPERRNLKGSIFMILSMALFTVEDSIVKVLTSTLPVSQVLMIFGLGGLVIFTVITKMRGDVIFTSALLERTLIIRSAFEVLGRVFFVLALAYTALSTTSAILQATPLLVTAASVFIFKETVSRLRWSIIALGFLGVLIVLRPGAADTSILSILAVLGMIGFAGRDLGTRAAPKGLSFAQLGVYGFAALTLSGVFLYPWDGGPIELTLTHGLWFMLLWGVGALAYTLLTLSMRTGEMSVVAPFRYSRLLFAMGFAALIFGERPDTMEIVGGAIIVISGLLLMLTSQTQRR
jgi:drug/metabolite transporter (DMT)-like permease